MTMPEITNKIYYCPAELLIDQLTGRFKSTILLALVDGKLGFPELAERLPLVSQKMLARQLRALARDGLVERYRSRQDPPPIEYVLTATGQRLVPLLEQLKELGDVLAARDGVRVEQLASSGSSAAALSPA